MGISHVARQLPRDRALGAVITIGGLAGTATGGSATGAPAVDRLLRGGLVAGVAAAAAVAPTWAVLVLATGSATLGWGAGPLPAVSGATGLALAVLSVWKEGTHQHLLKAVIGAVAVNTLLRVPGGPLGATAAVTGALAVLVVVSGFRSFAPRGRRRLVLALTGLAALGGLAAVLGGLGGFSARSSFERSSSRVETALSAARSGDSPLAAESARGAAVDLRRARSSLGAWWARPGWAIPIVGAHLRAADRVAETAGPAVEAAAGSADALRLDVLRPAVGQLDLGRLDAAEPELARLSATLHLAERGAVDARSPWLVGPVQDRMRRYQMELADITATADRAHLAVQVLPGLLGRDRPTRWFVAVCSPAESRELGGFVGEYVILVAEKGSLRLERSGSVDDLGSKRAGRTLEGLDLPRRYLSQQPEIYWQNLTGYPDLPTVAAAVRSLWNQVAPQSPIDGVAYIDPHGLAALLRLTGPVPGPAPIGTVTAANAAELLLSEQYSRFDAKDERKDALQEVAKATFAKLSTAPLPPPGAMGSALAPAARGGHLLATSFSDGGQKLLDAIGASGRFPVADGGDLASLRTTNLVANKLDAHLRRAVRYRAVVDPVNDRVEATATIELRSDATADLPDYVASNVRGLPRGTNLLEVAWYSGLELEGIEVDGRPVAAVSDRERGWWTHSVTVAVPPGGASTVVVRLAGGLEASPYRLAVSPQAAAHEDLYTIEVVGRAGWAADPFEQPPPGRPSAVTVTLRRQ